MRSVRLVCILLALLLCAGCMSLPPIGEVSITPLPPSLPKTAKAKQTPTVEPTPGPTLFLSPSPSPTPEPTPTPTPEPITSARIESGEFDSYFDDALFLGDSITDMLSGYVRKCRETNPGLLGGAQIFGVTSMSAKYASLDTKSESSISFRYRGQAISVSEIINKTGAKKVFIMLGVNDIDCRLWSDVEGYFAQLIDLIHEKCPETELVIECILPVTEQYCRTSQVDIAHWNSFNAILSRICAKHGAIFLDFSDQFMDARGYLPKALSSDNLYHLSPEGEDIWIRALRIYAARQMCPDAEMLLSEN